MKEFKGTKGKWHAIEYAGRYTVQSGAYYGDMDILDYENFSKEEVDANARLIASAPELLEVLQDIVEMQERNYGDGMTTHLELIKLSKRAKELIKKITGE